jgi:hypothetical protein
MLHCHSLSDTVHSDTHIREQSQVSTSGTVPLPNQFYGVLIEDLPLRTPSSNNVIGGTATGANLLSGNGFAGIGISASANLIQGNLIGTDKSGSSVLGNADGIYLFDGSNNTIGGIAAT